MRPIIFILLLISFSYVSETYAQDEISPNALAVKGLMIDYEYPNINDDLDLSNATAGAEVTYIRHLNELLNIAVPFKFGRADIPVNETSYDDNIFVGLDALAHLKYFKRDALLSPYILAGLGATYNPATDVAINAPVGAGINIRVANKVYINGQGEYRLGFDKLDNNLQVGIGGMVLLGGSEPAPLDRDGDGIDDEEDKCPDDPGTLRLNGCPDRDNDNVADKDDACPDTPGLASMDGCPDSDGDGVIDPQDDCPKTAGLANMKGCPDTDGDGLIDKNDNCPDEPGLLRFDGCPDSDGDSIPDNVDECPELVGLAKFNGCPDTDGDGLRDMDDKCPTTAGPVENNGCPEIKEEDKETLEFAMRAVQFEFGSANLKASSRPVLDQIATILAKYPDYDLKISGHTDSVGSDEANQKLSQDRAETCYTYLINKGINAERVTYTGYGESKPIDTNQSDTGRKKNRRVEFELYVK